MNPDLRGFGNLGGLHKELIMKNWLLSSLVLFMFYANPTMAVEPVVGGMGMGMGCQSGWMGMSTQSGWSGWMGSNAANYMASGACGGAGLTFMSTVIGGAAGFGTAAVMNNTVYSGCQNKEACENAKVATYAGAAVGTVGTVVTVAMVGANGMGLATIGATIGGGMATGATILVAAPIVAAVAAGGATYWWFTHNLKKGQP